MSANILPDFSIRFLVRIPIVIVGSNGIIILVVLITNVNTIIDMISIVVIIIK